MPCHSMHTYACVHVVRQICLKIPSNLLHNPFLFKGKVTQALDIARRISGAVAGESTQKSTYQVPITNPYLPHYIICHLPLVFLSPTSPLPFYSPSLSLSLSLRPPLSLFASFCPSLVCLCVGLLACHDGSI